MRISSTPILAAFLCVAAWACAKKPTPPPPPTVTAATPLRLMMIDWDDYDGQFEATNSVDVRPRVSGYLISVGFKDGDYVAKGQRLFKIDPRPYQAALDQAKGQEIHDVAALANANTQADRGKLLLAAHTISQQAYDQLVANARQAEADLDSARATVRTNALNVGFTDVTAPLSGRISDRRVAPGNLVTADTTVLTNIVSLDPIWFGFTGSEALYLKYERANLAGTRTSSRFKANPVEIRLQDEPAYRWKGHMDFVDNALDPASGTIRGRAVIANPTHFLTPGMFGHLRLLGSGAYPALLIPDQAISTDQTREVVFVVGPGGKVTERGVSLGPLYATARVIRSGLGPDDLVIIDGVQRAKAGTKVAVRRGTIPTPAPPIAAPPGGNSEPVSTGAAPANVYFPAQ
ncbi:MAG TPA: efflux RND transporter periplasmic adaptor subunit [Caulobacteraceae bacterium]